jgi:glycosyltransferase involved in cell wall biosynthesis
VLAGLRAGRRLLYTAHGIAVQERAMGYSYPARLIWAEGFLVRRSRAVVCVSALLSSRISEEYPFAKGKIRVIPPLVDPSIAKEEAEDPGFPRPYILFPGAGPTKGLSHALKAFELLRKTRPKLRLVVLSATGGPDLPGVIWSKPLPTRLMAGAYLAAELTLNASDYESFGLPVIEAASLGKPFLVSQNSGVSEYVRERFPELAVDPSDHEALVERIALTIEAPPAPDSLRSWAQRFSAERVLGEYLEVYKEIST